MPAPSRPLLVARLVALPTVFDALAATRSTTFTVSAMVAPECAIAIEDNARAAAAMSSTANSAVSTRCSNEASYQVARSTPSEAAPFATTETPILDSGSTVRVVRITITF